MLIRPHKSYFSFGIMRIHSSACFLHLSVSFLAVVLNNR